MYTAIQNYCDQRAKEFDSISKERQALLLKISAYANSRRVLNKAVNLVYICTHNSRRSHFGQIWAQVACDYYKLTNINSFSGGTETTAFNNYAINALKRVGFSIQTTGNNENPHYHVKYDNEQPAIVSYSKIYNDKVNPGKEFAAIMTCGEAEENCPFIPGAEARIATSYEDPKAFDNTPQQDAMYDERCKQVALETLYVFSSIK
ncbi:MAG TPA: protein-tyrosine-phosphatase [Bacteroidia bacterium]|nr:protein-tyrosine-phosphatase [Bacteroidia bacterium]